MSLLTRLATEDAQLFRNPPAAAGVVAPPVLVTAIKITPILPYSYDVPIKVTYENKAPVNRFVTYTVGPLEVRDGDTLMVGSVKYTVRNPGEWDTIGSAKLDFVELVLDRVKGS